MLPLPRDLEEKLVRFAQLLVDQSRARIVVPPQAPAAGFWFGGGNLAAGPDGALYLVGRYRNAGDSRTGVAAGVRGLELAVFASRDGGRNWEKRLSFSKSALDVAGRPVLSIEGSALRFDGDVVELFVSTEKDRVGYPPGFESFLKPGTGVWSIERLAASSLEGLATAPPETILQSADPRHVHVKDPFVYAARGGDLYLLFCSHPYCWTSSNTGFLRRPAGENTFESPVFEFFPRGMTWDVAITRGTCVLDIPPVGPFRDLRSSLLFYDGGECVRNLDEHAEAIARPRGYSCEELGGAAYVCDGNLLQQERLSRDQPLFVSPHGTGCSRYVNVLATPDAFYATWQQSQSDGSQPLVMTVTPREDAEAALR